MPRHRIITEIPAQSVVNADLTVTVWSDDTLLGELLVSRGSIDWRPRNLHHVFELEWEQFDKVLRENGRKVRKGVHRPE